MTTKLQFTAGDFQIQGCDDASREHFNLHLRDKIVARANARLAEMLAAAPERTECWQCGANLKQDGHRLVDVEELQ